VEDQIRAVEEIAREHGAQGFTWAASLEDRNTLWQARHNAYYATVASRPGARAWTTDICVPISHLAECILETQADITAANVVAPLVGHAGDGNFHLIIMLDPDDRQEFETISRLSERLVERALKFGGTCSGEHGVGFGKLKYLQAEHGAALDVMRAIKRAIDPDNLMNPGKLIPQ
jgi:D-lactate dehydrogenase (cytochrome)